MDALFSMWSREMKKFLRNRSRITSSLGQPLMYLIILGYGFKDVFRAAGHGNYIDYLAPGIVAMAVIFGAFVGGLSVLWDRKFGFLKETLVAPSPRFLVIMGRAIGSATTAAIQGVLVLIVAAVFGFHFDFLRLFPAAFGFMLLIGLLLSSIGIFFGSMIEDFQSIQLVTSFVLMPLYFLSGSLFPLHSSDGSDALYLLARINPLTYGVDGLRALLGQGSQFGVGFDFAVAAILSIVFAFLASYSFSRTRI